MDRKYFYVSTPIYYVNDKPHIGHAYTTILADVLARYHRLCGIPTWFLTGTDEHGQKVRQAAIKAGITPKEQADQTVVRFQELWKKLGITNDDFIRTTEARHGKIVQATLQNLYDRGEIYAADYDGWYCVACERFFAESELLDGKCPDPGCGRAVEPIRESNYFFRMSHYQDWLVDYIKTHDRFILPEFRRNETLGFLRKPLKDLCISRPKSRMDWGIELPFDNRFVTYVWFDALMNYVTAIGYGADDARFAKWWPVTYHLIGKDILTTHTVYWPTMLKAMGLPMPETVFAHGWWLSGQDKMSKTSGNAVNPMEFADRHGVDAFRYFLMAEMSLGQDASFTEEAFVRRYNADLANDLGNLLSRLVKLMTSHVGSRIPRPPRPEEPDDTALRESVLKAARDMNDSVERMRPDQGIEGLTGMVRETNRYLEKTAPWTLAKEGRIERLEGVLYTAAEALRIVSGLLHPVMPEKMEQLRGVLGLPLGAPLFADLSTWGGLKSGGAVGAMVSLFPRIVAEGAQAGAATAASSGPVADSAKIPGVVTIEYADFQKVQLRTARILAAERVQGADKLLRIEIEVGGEKRQIVAGIAKHYAPESLPGRTIVVVVNLKPAKIRGVESNGMLLAASSGDAMRLVTVDGDLPSGAVVK
jgi:methionyl-tRNA synthetase